MNETPSVRALLDVEDAAPDVLFERVPGSDAYLWPLARWPIARALAEAHVNVVGHASKRPGRTQVLKRVARLALPNPMSSDRLRTQTDHLFIVTGTTRTTAERGVGNWLSDSFAEALGDRAAVVQDAPVDVVTPRPERPANPRTWTYAPAISRIWRATQRSPLTATDQERVVGHLDRIFDLFAHHLAEPVRERLVREVLPLANRTAHADAEFAALLDRTRPRRIYMQMAAYGDRSSLIRLAHERGIEVAELQHGWIGASHAAYNFGRAVRSTELGSSFPDTLLTFGDYWGRRLRFPGDIVPVGKPLLERAASEAPPFAERPERLLVISSVHEREKLIAAVRSLQRHLPESWDIALRPHPSERADAAELFAELLAEGIALDSEPDLNASISRSRALVGMTSTVLFEALPFGVRIGVIETGLAEHYADASVFPERLHDEGSFATFARTVQNSAPAGRTELDDIWLPGSVAAFTHLPFRSVTMEP